MRKQEIPFSSEQKWMAVKCSPKNEVSRPLCPLLPLPAKAKRRRQEEFKVFSYFYENTNV